MPVSRSVSFAAFLCLCASAPAAAQTPGSLDTTFASGGKYVSDMGGAPEFGPAVAIQVDSRIVVAGKQNNGRDDDFATLRLTRTGALDTSFNGTGSVVLSLPPRDDNAKSVLILPDGRILVGGEGSRAGYGQHTVLRYCHKVLLQADGRIVLVGSQVRSGVGDFMLVRVTSTGSLDTTFGSGGVVITEFGGRSPSSSDEASAGVLQPDGKIIAGGYTEGTFAIARYLSTGALDPSFGTGGLVSFAVGSGGDDQIKSLALAPDGKIVAAGYSKISGTNYKMAIARLTNDSGGALADSDRLFNWAEVNYPQFFSPPGPATETIQGYRARVYRSGNAVATKDGHVFAYGTIFGGLLDVGVYAPNLAQAIRDGF